VKPVDGFDVIAGETNQKGFLDCSVSDSSGFGSLFRIRRQRSPTSVVDEGGVVWSGSSAPKLMRGTKKTAIRAKAIGGQTISRFSLQLESDDRNETGRQLGNPERRTDRRVDTVLSKQLWDA
jgi:hypothetical protein